MSFNTFFLFSYLEKNIATIIGIRFIKINNTDEPVVLPSGYKINNIDSNIIAQAPKMMPYIPEMKATLAKAMDIDIESISIKAKTKEKLDSVGEKLAIETNAVVLLEK